MHMHLIASPIHTLLQRVQPNRPSVGDVYVIICSRGQYRAFVTLNKNTEPALAVSADAPPPNNLLQQRTFRRAVLRPEDGTREVVQPNYLQQEHGPGRTNRTWPSCSRLPKVTLKQADPFSFLLNENRNCNELIRHDRA